jgi:isoleucyl-tRNA synthetase
VALEELLDDLSNWYVRRSRRRFWKSESDADKNSAYATLYHVMVKLSRVLAPFTPFISEAIYQNLVRSVQPDAYESVHHTAWPRVEEQAIDAERTAQMDLARQVASLGLSARNAAGIKVRQPLAKVLVHAGKSQLDPELVDIVKDELNVKTFEFVQEAGRLVTYTLMPDNKLLGPRFGASFPRVRAALAQADPGQVVAAVSAGLPVRIQLDGEEVELAPEEVIVQTQPAAGLAVAADRRLTVAVDATLTPELRAEGLAREIVRRVQSMRKEAGFNVEDRITTFYQASGLIEEVMKSWDSYIRAETLSTRLEAGAGQEGSYTEEHKVDGEIVTLSVHKKES